VIVNGGMDTGHLVCHEVGKEDWNVSEQRKVRSRRRKTKDWDVQMALQNEVRSRPEKIATLVVG
jgi:hypothetical protein